MSCVELSDAEKAALRIRIAALEKKYDALISGSSISEFVDQNGERVKYTAVSATGLARLRAFIDSLIAMLSCVNQRRYRPRPMGFLFP